MNFCPCLQTFFSKFKAKKQRGAYHGHRQYQQEEFMNQKNQQNTLSDTIPKPKVVQLQKKINIEDQISQYFNQQQSTPKKQIYHRQQQKDLLGDNETLNIKIQFAQNIQNLSSTKQEKNIQDLIQEELLMTPSQAIKKTEENQRQKLLQSNLIFEDISQPVFSINLDPLDPYYGLIHEKTSKISDYFRLIGTKLEVGSPNKTSLQINLIDNPKKTSFTLNYSLSCSYSFYLSVFKNEKSFVSLSPLISESKTLETYKPNLRYNTLKLKKIGALQARDCYYIKYQNGGKKQHWQVYLNKQNAQSNPAYKTCQIFCLKSIRQKSDKQLVFSQYIEVDLLSTNTSSILPKIALQMRNFLNSLSDYINRNYEQQLV